MAFFSKKTEAEIVKVIAAPNRRSLKLVGVISGLVTVMHFLPNKGAPFDAVLTWIFIAAIGALLAIIVYSSLRSS